MIPELSHIDEGPVPTWITTQGTEGVSYRLNLIDAELTRPQHFAAGMAEALKRLPPEVICRFILSRKVEFEGGDHSRAEAIRELEFASSELQMTLERKSTSFLGRLLRWKRSDSRSPLSEILPLATLGEIGIRHCNPLTHEEIRRQFELAPSEWRSAPYGIETGTECIGLIRLWKQSVQPFSEDAPAAVFSQLPAPFEVRVSLSRIPEVRAEALLRQKVRQQKGQGRIIEAKREAAESVLEETFLNGSALFRVEWVIVLKRKSERALREDLEDVAHLLRSFGEPMIETVGAVPSYVASLPGSGVQHIPFLERDSVVPYLLPVLTHGEPTQQELGARALPLHRRDGSLHAFDLFDPKRDNFNALVIGPSGSGKSVLTHLLTHSLLMDPNVSVIKVDVGGSYSKLCGLVGGTSYQFGFRDSAQINPFSILRDAESRKEGTGIIANLLCTLMLESNERSTAKLFRHMVEGLVAKYADSSPVAPSLADFLQLSESFPRKELLSRWAPGGVYGHVLSQDSAESIGVERYRYFNIQAIQQAADQDFAEGVMAMLMACFNAELLLAKDRRIALIVDESRFFFERNAQFFKFTTANFRKFGHSCVLISQTANEFILSGEDGRPDLGILHNCATKFLFPLHGDSSEYQRNFALTDWDIRKLNDLTSGAQKEVLLLAQQGSRTLSIELSKAEYWRGTTAFTENQKLEALQKAVPGLTVAEAIRCLSMRERSA